MNLYSHFMSLTRGGQS